jgi:hypothetical protein
MSSKELVDEILRLQEDATELVRRAVCALSSADDLSRELKHISSERFVCQGVAYKFEHRAIEFVPGNRDWLVPDPSVTVIG